MSVVECFPVVQGGMAINSSKVSTRGLQHFQPSNVSDIQSYRTIQAVKSSTVQFPLTLLPLVKDWWAWMVDTVLLRVCVYFATTFMNTFLGHFEEQSQRKEK